MVLLGATLFHAMRLERALGVLKRDRAALQELIASFNTSTRQAEQGIQQLRAAADGAGRQIARQIEQAASLKGDLSYLADRGDRIADRLDQLVRAGKPLASDPPAQLEEFYAPPAAAEPPLHDEMSAKPSFRLSDFGASEIAPAGELGVRSQAERDLLKALRLAR
jgi:hypothetical protein